MGRRNKKRETLRRLDSKTLDARFLAEIRNDLNCSPFEAEAVLEVVKEVYFPFLDEESVKASPCQFEAFAGNFIVDKRHETSKNINVTLEHRQG